jgi:hypothetical protein
MMKTDSARAFARTIERANLHAYSQRRQLVALALGEQTHGPGPSPSTAVGDGVIDD